MNQRHERSAETGMRRGKLTRALIGWCVAALVLALRALASSAVFTFSANPLQDPNFIITSTVSDPLWGGFYDDANGNPGGYIAITRSATHQFSQVLFPDFDGGRVIQAFTIECDLRLGNPTLNNGRPADGFSINYARAGDPAVQNLLHNPESTDLRYYALADAPETGTTTGIAISFDTWSGNMLPDAPDIEGIIVRVDNVTVLRYPMPTRNGTCDDRTSLQTGTYSDSTAGWYGELCWARLQVMLDTNAALTVTYKGVVVLDHLQTAYFPSAGRLLVAGRTGDANENAHLDNVRIDTIAADQSVFSGGSADAKGYTLYLNDSGQSVVDPNTIRAIIDGVDMAPTSISRNGGTTTVAILTAPNWLPSGSRHTARVNFLDTQTNALGGTREIIVAAYNSITPDQAVTGVNLTRRGFLVRTWQSPAPPELANDNDRIEQQLFGELGANVAADPTLFDHVIPDTSVKYAVEPHYLNHDQAGADQGMFSSMSEVPQQQAPELQIPGITPGVVSNLALEALFFVEFPAADWYTFGVNSDDGFRVRAGRNPLDRFQVDSVLLGEFVGGRGTMGTPQSVFGFLVPTPGVYPLRFTWEQGGGGANFELYQQLKDGTYALINDTDRAPSVLKAYWDGPHTARAYISKVVPGVGGVNAEPNTPLEITVTDAETSLSTAFLKLQVNGTEVVPMVTKTGRATTISYQPVDGWNAGALATIRLTYVESGQSARDQSFAFSFTNAPTIFSQPASTNALSGQAATLTVVAAGSGPLRYQWFAGGKGDTNQPISGASGPNLDTGSLTNSAIFWVRVANRVGSIDSDSAVITVRQAPEILTQPVSMSLASGQTATLRVEAAGSEPLTYQWFMGTRGETNLPILDATHSVFVTAPLTNSLRVWVRVLNSAGIAESDTAFIAILYPPEILIQPASQDLLAGEERTLEVIVTGSEPLTYQWFDGEQGESDRQIAGATNATFATGPLAASASFWVRVHNSVGNAYSEIAFINVGVLPQISSPPASQTRRLGEAVQLFVAVTNTTPVTYQWFLNSQPIAGATNEHYWIRPVRLADGGRYTVVASNGFGTTESPPAALELDLPAIVLTDNFADRHLAFTPAFSGKASNTAPTHEAGEPNHAGKSGTGSVWFSWMATQSGVVTFSTAGSTFDTAMAVYTGSNIAALQEAVVASDDDSGSFHTSKVQFNAVAGTVYEIAIDGFASIGSLDSIVLGWMIDPGIPPQGNNAPWERQFGLGTLNGAIYSPDAAHILTYGGFGAYLWSVTNGPSSAFSLGVADWINGAVFSPDGAVVLTASLYGMAKLWSVADGTLLRTFTGHSGQLTSVAFSPDGTRVLTGSYDQTAKLWSVADGSLMQTLEGHTNTITSVAFTPAGDHVLTGSADGTARLWAAADASLLVTLVGHSDMVTSIAVSNDGEWLLTGSEDHTAKLWSAADGTLLRTFAYHSDAVTSVAFSPDGAQVLTGSRDWSAWLWSASDGTRLQLFLWNSGGVTSVAFSTDGNQTLTAGADQTVRLWSKADATLVRTYWGHTWPVSSVAFSGNGQQLCTGAGVGEVKLWAETDGGLLQSWYVPQGSVGGVVVSSDGTEVLTGCRDSTARLWSAADGSLRRTFAGHSGEVTSVARSSDGASILTGSYDRTAKLWLVEDAALLRTFVGHSDVVTSVALSPDGRKVLTGSRDQTARLWSVEEGRLLRMFPHTDWVNCVAVSPNGTTVLTGGWEGAARLWPVEGGSPLRTFPSASGSVSSVAFSPDGTRIAAGSGGTAQLWSVADGSLLRSLEGHTGGITGGVAFSPDGTRVLTGGADGTALLWDVGPAPPQAPLLLNQPISQSVAAGKNVSVSVSVTGTQPLSFQWQFNAEKLPGQTNASLILTNVGAPDEGDYAVTVSNAFGSGTSQAATLTLTNADCAPPPAGLTAWWAAEGDAADRTGKSDGSLKRAGFTTGRVGAAFSFDGTNGFMSVPDSPALSPHTGANGELSVEAWIKLPEFPAFQPDTEGQYRWVLAKGDGNSGWEYGIGVGTNGVVAFVLWTSSGTQYAAASGGPISLRQWHHLVGSFRKGQFLRLYLDGLKVDEGTQFFGETQRSAAPLYVGARSDGQFLQAAIDEVSIYRQALAAGEIAALYAAGSAGKCLGDFPAGIFGAPQSQRVRLGDSVTFRVDASGSEPIVYQWRLNAQMISGATNASFTIPSVTLTNGGSYTVVVGNGFGVVESPPAVLELDLPAIAFADNFADRHVYTDETFTGSGFNSSASREPGEPYHAGKLGTNSVWLSWQAPAAGVATFSTAGSSFDTLLAVYTGNTFTELGRNVLASDDDRGGFLTSEVSFNAEAGTYYQIAVEGFDRAMGQIVLAWHLDVGTQPLPEITQQPVSLLKAIGEEVRFTVNVTSANVTCQWQRNGKEIVGATETNLFFIAQPERVGIYRVRVTNPGGRSLESADAALEVINSRNAWASLTADKLADLFPEDRRTVGVGLAGRGQLADAPPSQGPIDGQQEGDGRRATASPDDPQPCGVITQSTVWYRLKPKKLGSSMYLTAEGSGFPVLLAVYTNRLALSQVCCTNGSVTVPAAVTFRRVPNEDYLVMVAGMNGAQGHFTLNFKEQADEDANFLRVQTFGGHLLLRRAVKPGQYWLDTGSDPSDPAKLTNVVPRTNVTSGLFEYYDPQLATDPVKLYFLMSTNKP